MSSSAGPTRIVVVGNGMVGHRFVEALLQARPDLPAAGHAGKRGPLGFMN